MSEHISESISFVHNMTLSHGRNAEVWDTAGKRYIDFVGGIGVLNLGHCNPQVVTAIQDQAAKLTHYCFNATPHDPYIRFMQQLTQFVPVSYPLSGMLTNSGAEAAENALKIVRGATGRTAVIAFDGGFHGRTLATLNLNGKVAPYKQKVGVLPGPVFHVPFPSKDNGVSTEQALKAMDRLFSVEIDVNDVGCIIFEPVQGEGGFLAMQPDFAQALRAFCDKHGIVLIADEIQSGFGRTGQRFAFSRLGIEPDLILLGKSIAGGIPLGAVVGRKPLLDNLPKGGLGGTYGGNALSCAAALAVIDTYEQENLLARGEQLGEHLRAGLLKLKERYACIGDVRGTGFMLAMEMVKNDAARSPDADLNQKVIDQARLGGLLVIKCGVYRNVLRFLAPLVTTEQQIDEALGILDAALARVLKSS
ncbi:4-aminobutyrate aminotransferase [Pseudomonas syringae pv. syringae]|uniref:aspartate aminotransferase family protein n=1 Tax=Pseudomonas syringae TaxID=317 RepID=UPI000EFDE6EA|nr:aspartate aminotransferase family protein [Pseudomonas syringae]RMR50852.1 4-aminobutyrate aminotransferase [Pseudomonas syringae pv. syringae]